MKTLDEILTECRALDKTYAEAMPKIEHGFKVGDGVTVINPDLEDDYMFNFTVDEVDNYGNLILTDGRDYYLEVSYKDIERKTP